VQAVYIGQ